MNAETPEDRLLEKLLKIKAMAEGAAAIKSEAEAQAFADMLNALLHKHKLEMSDLEFADLEKTEPVERDTWNDYNKRVTLMHDAGVRHRKIRVDWMERLASAIARAHCCRIIVVASSSVVQLVGRRSDRAVAEYMIITLTRAAQDLAKKEHGKYSWEIYQRDGNCRAANGFKAAFLRSFVLRLIERFDELKRQRTEGNTSTSTALVRIDREQKAADDFMKNLQDAKDVRDAPGLRRHVEYHGEGVQRGRRLAEGVDLGGKAIESSGTTRKRLAS